jgi:hypothetical protein
MSIIRKIKRSLRGDVGPRATSLEAARHIAVALRRRRERNMLTSRNGRVASEEHDAQLATAFATMNATQLLTHFRDRKTPQFFPGVERPAGKRLDKISEDAREVLAHRWPLLGLGKIDFGLEIDWLRDPVSGRRWPLEYHGDVTLTSGDGSDARLLWELNRLGHLLTLACAYATTSDESFAEEFFNQVDSWQEQNPAGFGPNWACAMEVALRSMNLLAAFHLFRNASALNERRLAAMLALFDTHGRHVRRHLEYSYIATGNHYLADVTGLLWLGVSFPELEAAGDWREFGLQEVLREMDKQVLADGADDEASTGYHRFVTELFLYSFIFCRANGIEIAEKYWQRLRSMLEYIRAYLRPDGRAPLIGDSDGGQVLPLVRRDADDHAYLIVLGAALFEEPSFKISDDAPEELLWLFGSEGARSYKELKTAGSQQATSGCFKHAGTCVLRNEDLYLLLSASGAGLRGRGAHSHNDALSVEVSAGGVNFLSDPGTYVYTSDLRARHMFRSTAYHSTVEVDGEEQNLINVETPFIVGDEAKPRIVEWESDEDRDLAVAEHYGYQRLPEPITHRRAVRFEKREGFWLIEDSLLGSGVHDFRFFFQIAPERLVTVSDDAGAQIRDRVGGAQLFLVSLDSLRGPALEQRWSSRNYGSKVETVAVCWQLNAAAPLTARWLLVPVRAGEDERERLELIASYRLKSCF